MFSLEKFKIKHKSSVIYDCNFGDEFSNSRENIFTTLIIGENGVGKSYLLRTILDFFRFAMKDDATNFFKYENSQVEYSINSTRYKVIKKLGKTSYFKNEKESDYQEMQFPSRMLNLSFMVNDKFSFSSNLDDKYRYLGVRSTSNATYTSSIQKKLLSSFLTCFKEQHRLDSLNKVLSFIGLTTKVEVVYKIRRKTLLTKAINESVLHKKISDLFKRKQYVNKKYKDIDYSVDRILRFIDELKSNKYHTKEHLSFNFDTSEDSNKHNFSELELLEFLEFLEFISTPDIKFAKDESFNFEHTSSGEKHFIFTMINLIANIEDNSLVLIDEPELSLHPRWQMQYIRLLKDILKKYSGSHCILASHSHFMVSALEPKSSSLMSLTNIVDGDVKGRVSNLIGYSTYAWSAENILYEVFQLRTARNYYFESDMAELLKLISNQSGDIERIKLLNEKLSGYVFDSKDPINSILQSAKSYIERVS